MMTRAALWRGMAKIKRTSAPLNLIDINDASNQQFKKLTSLNNGFASETSVLSVEQLEKMAGAAFCALAITPDVGMLIAFDENADYDSENFKYLKSIEKDFIYIDRIIINKQHQGMGIGTGFYETLIEMAQEEGKAKLLCEVNIDPENEISIAFHEGMGFEVIGERTLTNGKTVRYYSFEI